MPQIFANNIAIEYESFGPDTGETVLLIMGYGGQLTMWPEELCTSLAELGYRAIRFDNRDVGLSEKLEGITALDGAEIARRKAEGLPLDGAYSLDDMADDAVGVLDAFDIPKAHMVGASMGAMIAQLVAANHPDRVLSLTSIMSPSANPEIPLNSPTYEGGSLAVTEPSSPQAIVDHQVRLHVALASPLFPEPEAVLRAAITRDVERCYYPEGLQRQGGAIGASHDRLAKLQDIRAPTIVLHGDADPLVPIESAYDIAKHVAGAELRIVRGMSHGLPAPLVPTILEAILSVARHAAE